MDTNHKGKTLGWFLWRRDWYSICSAHRRPEQGCRCCMTGRYIWYVPHLFGSLIYRFAPNVWRWWANRPNSSVRKHLESIFPNLK